MVAAAAAAAGRMTRREVGDEGEVEREREGFVTQILRKLFV